MSDTQCSSADQASDMELLQGADTHSLTQNINQIWAPISTQEALLQASPHPHERVLYWGSGSPQAWRVLITLEEKKVAYRGICISFSSNVLKSPTFRAINPRARVPVLIEPIDPITNTRTVLYECGAILEYLEKKFQNHSCMPSLSDLTLFALAEMRLHESNELLSAVGDLIIHLRRNNASEQQRNMIQHKWRQLEQELMLWESYLHENSYLVDSKHIYLCDIAVFTNLAYAVRCGLQLDGLYPKLAMFYMHMCARPSVQKTWPPHWHVTPNNELLCRR